MRTTTLSQESRRHHTAHIPFLSSTEDTQAQHDPGLPIVSACNCPTENISAYHDEVLAPIVKSLPTYVNDTNHALHIIASSDLIPLL